MKTETKTDPAANYSKRATIEITPNGPADTVRVFYAHLREKKFRDALFLTNLRPAIEGLTEAELDELKVDFEQIAVGVPAEVEINGEIISGDYATVTAKLPDNETREIKLQEIRLRKEGNVWVILTVDETAETAIKKEGNRYFFNLKIKTHESEARAMIERIFKSQTVYALQNGGLFGELDQLIGAGLLPDDVRTSESTGYNFVLILSGDKKKYYATAVPAVYGKTGKLSYLLEFEGKNPKISSKDVQGQSLKK
ncbi:MAG: hypothetical protein IPK58_14585 [Acidobacteria bacterium]|nr:hypothetical protein [Acidobacteriota bacterium]